MLHGEALQEFDKRSSKNNGALNLHLKHIQEGLIRYFSMINVLSKQNRMMPHSMKKPRNLPFKIFTLQRNLKIVYHSSPHQTNPIWWLPKNWIKSFSVPFLIDGPNIPTLKDGNLK